MPQAVWNGVVVAQSDDTIVVEGNHYFPADSIVAEYFIPSKSTSACGWKGSANYYTLKVDGQENVDAAWYYPNPEPEAANIKGRIAFWKGVSVE